MGEKLLYSHEHSLKNTGLAFNELIQSSKSLKIKGNYTCQRTAKCFKTFYKMNFTKVLLYRCRK